TGTIVTASAQLIAARDRAPLAEIVRDMHERIAIHTAPTERAEAEAVIKSIEQMLGGHTFFSIDSGRGTGAEKNASFGDFAVLYRTDAQWVALVEASERSGIPYKKSSHTPLADEPAVRALLQELDVEPADTALADALRAAAQRLEARSAGTTGVALPRLLAL